MQTLSRSKIHHKPNFDLSNNSIFAYAFVSNILCCNRTIFINLVYGNLRYGCPIVIDSEKYVTMGRDATMSTVYMDNPKVVAFNVVEAKLFRLCHRLLSLADLSCKITVKVPRPVLLAAGLVAEVGGDQRLKDSQHLLAKRDHDFQGFVVPGIAVAERLPARHDLGSDINVSPQALQLMAP